MELLIPTDAPMPSAKAEAPPAKNIGTPEQKQTNVVSMNRDIINAATSTRLPKRDDTQSNSRSNKWCPWNLVCRHR